MDSLLRELHLPSGNATPKAIRSQDLLQLLLNGHAKRFPAAPAHLLCYAYVSSGPPTKLPAPYNRMPVSWSEEATYCFYMPDKTQPVTFVNVINLEGEMQILDTLLFVQTRTETAIYGSSEHVRYFVRFVENTFQQKVDVIEKPITEDILTVFLLAHIFIKCNSTSKRLTTLAQEMHLLLKQHSDLRVRFLAAATA